MPELAPDLGVLGTHLEGRGEAPSRSAADAVAARSIRTGGRAVAADPVGRSLLQPHPGQRPGRGPWPAPATGAARRRGGRRRGRRRSPPAPDRRPRRRGWARVAGQAPAVPASWRPPRSRPSPADQATHPIAVPRASRPSLGPTRRPAGAPQRAIVARRRSSAPRHTTVAANGAGAARRPNSSHRTATSTIPSPSPPPSSGPGHARATPVRPWPPTVVGRTRVSAWSTPAPESPSEDGPGPDEGPHPSEGRPSARATRPRQHAAPSGRSTGRSPRRRSLGSPNGAGNDGPGPVPS